ncbi:hypothetical protein NDU88_007057 [Pleurodeles waltl]|uniref:Uncharacterized protein n=1 Tax=Pleurodeles waltl TaxID=8319 RepID=A0AAV7NV89_PLEWA|nr:hypothetical protein NDU88_007057 [Pleurodeles waltl]
MQLIRVSYNEHFIYKLADDLPAFEQTQCPVIEIVNIEHRFSANTATDSSDCRCSRVSEDCVYRSHDSMGVDPDALKPDFRVPDRVKIDDGLRGKGEEESLDATEANKRT